MPSDGIYVKSGTSEISNVTSKASDIPNRNKPQTSSSVNNAVSLGMSYNSFALLSELDLAATEECFSHRSHSSER